MKNLFVIGLITFWIGCSSGEVKSEDHTHHTEHSIHTTETQNKPKTKSPKQMAMTNVGNNHVHIEYHSPSVRGRQIFGGLVAYDEVWVTGAHMATSVHFSQDVEIDEVIIPAGKYALFTIPGESKWTVIINKNWDQHLADEYDQEEDILRFEVLPQKLENAIESLTYEVTPIDDASGQITISWDETAIDFYFKNV